MALKEFSAGTIVSVVFMIAAGQSAFGGGSPMESVWMWGLGLLAYVPVALLTILSKTSLWFLTPFAALAVLWYLMELQHAVGEGVYLVILAGAILLGWGF